MAQGTSPYKMLLTFKEVYKLPTHEMNRIMYGEESGGPELSQDPIILREHFEDDETRETMKTFRSTQNSNEPCHPFPTLLKNA